MDEKRDLTVDRIASIIGNVVTYNIKTKRHYTPLQSRKAIFNSKYLNLQSLWLAHSIRKAGRNKIIIELLHGYGLTLSNSSK